MPAVFKEASDNEEIQKARQDLLDAYLSNQIATIESAVEKASSNNSEG